MLQPAWIEYSTRAAVAKNSCRRLSCSQESFYRPSPSPVWTVKDSFTQGRDGCVDSSSLSLGKLAKVHEWNMSIGLKIIALTPGIGSEEWHSRLNTALPACQKSDHFLTFSAVLTKSWTSPYLHARLGLKSSILKLAMTEGARIGTRHLVSGSLAVWTISARSQLQAKAVKADSLSPQD